MSALDKLLKVTPKTGTPEHRLITALREALKAYDRETRLDLRRFNGKRHIEPRSVQKGVRMVHGGSSIRCAARAVGVSYGTLWKALQREGSKQA